ISKVLTYFRKNGNSIELSKLCFTIKDEHKRNYFIRPQRFSFVKNYLVITYVDTDSLGITNASSVIRLAVFDRNKSDYYPNPEYFINTKMPANNINNLGFTLFINQVFVFDNANKEYLVIDSKSGDIIKNSFSELCVRFVYDVFINEQEKLEMIY